MKKLLVFPVVSACLAFVSCETPMGGSGGSARGWRPKDGALVEGQRTDRLACIRKARKAGGRARHSCKLGIA